jgi:hypothetical protein
MRCRHDGDSDNGIEYIPASVFDIGRPSDISPVSECSPDAAIRPLFDESVARLGSERHDHTRFKASQAFVEGVNTFRDRET